MNINQLKKLLAITGLAAVSAMNQASGAGFSSSVLTPITFNGGGAVNSAQVSWGYFESKNVATVRSEISGLNDNSLLTYYYDNFKFLKTATMSGATGTQVNTSLLAQQESAAVGKDMWAIVQAQVGGSGAFYNALFYQVDDFADPAVNYTWTTTAFTEGLANTWTFAAPGDGYVEDYSVTSAAVLGTSSGQTLSLSTSTTAYAVPEPTSGSLLLLGAAGLVVLRRLRKSNV